ncbi:MAG: hypothetical protein ABIY70_15745 [Capsulimonas sp.]|uniref:hypothetical protein n=1 Tax=Capsulimonas sp. TaxID=2494211 RepID=UPI003266B42D
MKLTSTDPSAPFPSKSIFDTIVAKDVAEVVRMIEQGVELNMSIVDERIEAARLVNAYGAIHRRNTSGETAIDLAKRIALRSIHPDGVTEIIALLDQERFT